MRRLHESMLHICFRKATLELNDEEYYGRDAVFKRVCRRQWG
jgi:hypothetical protein